MRSSDHGQTWTTIHSFGHAVAWVALDPHDANRAYAQVAHSTEGGVWTTANLAAGASSTWTRLPAPPRTQGHGYNLVVLDDGALVASYSGRRDATGAFTASSGGIAVTQAATDASGVAKATLSTAGDATLRTITVTANASGVTGTTNVAVIAPPHRARRSSRCHARRRR